MHKIHFFKEEVAFPLLKREEIRKWIELVVNQHEQEIECINYIYCSDNYLLEINKSYLDHDYFTDIITFDNRDEKEQPLDADIFISIDRVVDNAAQLQTTFENELRRVMIHGVLHLLGFEDHTSEQKTLMRKKEEASLSLLKV